MCLLKFALLCFALLCFAVLCFALLCFALLCFALLCFALLCFDLLCFALLCFFYTTWPVFLLFFIILIITRTLRLRLRLRLLLRLRLPSTLRPSSANVWSLREAIIRGERPSIDTVVGDMALYYERPPRPNKFVVPLGPGQVGV
jgi:hypothetical protein